MQVESCTRESQKAQKIAMKKIPPKNTVSLQITKIYLSLWIKIMEHVFSQMFLSISFFKLFILNSILQIYSVKVDL